MGDEKDKPEPGDIVILPGVLGYVGTRHGTKLIYARNTHLDTGRAAVLAGLVSEPLPMPNFDAIGLSQTPALNPFPTVAEEFARDTTDWTHVPDAIALPPSEPPLNRAQRRARDRSLRHRRGK